MKNVLGLILKKENVIIDGKKVEVFSYFTSMGTPKKIKSITLTINDVEEEVSDIRNIGDDANYYYVRAKAREEVNDDLIMACNSRYKDSCFTINDGKIVEIRDEKLLDKINKYLMNNSVNNIYNDLTSNIIGQDEHIKSVMESILWNNYLINSGLSCDTVARQKHNILIMGDTGTGKTEIIRQIANSLNLPIVIENAPAYSLLDGDGSPVDKMLLDLVYVTNGDMEYAKRGILVIDNFDKLLTSNEHYGQLTSDFIQKDLFKLIDGDVRKFKYDEELITLDTHGLTIVILGNFNLNDNKVFGFDNKPLENSLDNKLIKLGIKEELMQRISKIRRLNNLSHNDLVKVLKSRDGKLMAYINYLKTRGITVKLDKYFIDNLVTRAIEDGQGVRSLNKIIDKTIDNGFEELALNRVKVKRKEL